MSIPSFAVVGHPNKGKSSIVATLAHDDSVAVGPQPGTTSRTSYYPMVIEGETLYILVDTPGFQRARKVLHWMKSHETTAAKRHEIVRQFVYDKEAAQQFPEEHELLKPIVEGAGVLYVVDGSVPYGSEYEAEMEILRWTGRPSMALINPIGSSSYIEDWRAALNQYFKVVRVFNAVEANFPKRVSLLETFGELEEPWRQPVRRAVSALRRDRNRRLIEASRSTADTIAEMMTFQVTKQMHEGESLEGLRPALEREFFEKLKKKESALRDRIEKIYGQHHIRRKEPELTVLETSELFSERAWLLFGLRKHEILVLGAIGGGVFGAGVDAALGGASFLLGTLIGGGAGAFAALRSADAVAKIQLFNRPLGGVNASIGPSKNLQLPHVIFNRARLHHFLVAGRTHAERSELRLDVLPEALLSRISDEALRALERCFRLVRSGDVSQGRGALSEVIRGIYREDTLESLDESET